MRSVVEMTPIQLRAAAHDAILRELGVVGLVRYQRTITPCEGDYARDRWDILPKYGSLEEVFVDARVAEEELREQGLIS